MGIWDAYVNDSWRFAAEFNIDKVTDCLDSGTVLSWVWSLWDERSKIAVKIYSFAFKVRQLTDFFLCKERVGGVAKYWRSVCSRRALATTCTKSSL